MEEDFSETSETSSEKTSHTGNYGNNLFNCDVEERKIAFNNNILFPFSMNCSKLNSFAIN